MPPTKSATITAKADASPWPATVDTLISRRWGEQGWQFPEFGRPAGKEVVVCTVDEVRRAGINDLIELRYPDFATRTAAVADLVASVSSTLVTPGKLTNCEYAKLIREPLYRALPFLNATVREALARELVALHSGQQP